MNQLLINFRHPFLQNNEILNLRDAPDPAAPAYFHKDHVLHVETSDGKIHYYPLDTVQKFTMIPTGASA